MSYIAFSLVAAFIVMCLCHQAWARAVARTLNRHATAMEAYRSSWHRRKRRRAPVDKSIRLRG